VQGDRRGEVLDLLMAARVRARRQCIRGLPPRAIGRSIELPTRPNEATLGAGRARAFLPLFGAAALACEAWPERLSRLPKPRVFRSLGGRAGSLEVLDALLGRIQDAHVGLRMQDRGFDQ
jgi:hypothetical protein